MNLRISEEIVLINIANNLLLENDNRSSIRLSHLSRHPCIFFFSLINVTIIFCYYFCYCATVNKTIEVTADGVNWELAWGSLLQKTLSSVLFRKKEMLTFCKQNQLAKLTAHRVFCIQRLLKAIIWWTFVKK